jgi:signal transduction histidine kinase
MPSDVARHAALRSRTLVIGTPGIRALCGLLIASSFYAVLAYPRSSPGGELAVIVGIASVIAFLAVGLSMQASEGRERMGTLLIGAGVFSSLWLLQGSSNALAFTVGRLCSGLVAVLFGYLILAYPTGRLHGRATRSFFALVGVSLTLSWIVIELTSAQPPFATPLMRCAPHCPEDLLYVGHLSIAGPGLWGFTRVVWLVMAWGLVVILLGRLRGVSAPVRESFAPVLAWAAAYALLLTAFLLTATVLSSHPLSASIRSLSTAIVPAIPLMMLLGSTRESLLMGKALSAFVRSLADGRVTDPQALMAAPMHDPSLQILYWRPTVQGYVDSSGALAAAPAVDDHRAVTRIERDGRPLALVIHDSELSDQRGFIEAAGAAGVIWFRNAQLAAELNASIADLAASRTRLVDAADAERQKIEHSLHDGAQQHLVGMRLRLELAAEAVGSNPTRGVQMLAEIGEQMDEALEAVRSLAKGVYPPLLPEHGLGDAIRSVNRRSPWPASIDSSGIGRYPADTEAAVYFCCLEALQNITKHAGAGVTSSIRLWDDGKRLLFEVSDEGSGFTHEAIKPGDGLINMRDRMETIGGALTVSSRKGQGTRVRGSVPVAPRHAATGRRS